MITINNSLFSNNTYSKIHCLYASKEYMLKHVCTESINIIYVQLYANYYVKQILSNIIRFIYLSILHRRPKNDSTICEASCSSSDRTTGSPEKRARRTGTTGLFSSLQRRFLSSRSGRRLPALCARPEEVLLYCL